MGDAAFGTKLQMESETTPGTYIDLANITKIGGPDFSVDTDDTTAHDSLDAFEEVVATIVRTGEVTFDMNWEADDTTTSPTDGFMDVLTARKLKKWKIVWPTTPATELLFDGYATKFNQNSPHDGKLSATGAIKVHGKPTLW